MYDHRLKGSLFCVVFVPQNIKLDWSRDNDFDNILYLCAKLVFLQVIAESLSEDEIAGLKEMFKMIDTDNSGQITYEELKTGLERVGAKLKESEIYALMEAVSVVCSVLFYFSSHP